MTSDSYNDSVAERNTQVDPLALVADVPGASPIARVLEGLQIHGVEHADPNEPDPREVPAHDDCRKAIDDVFDTIGHCYAETRCDRHLSNVLWNIVQAFHKAATDLITGELDRNEVAQREAQEAHDGSEIADTQLQRLTERGKQLMEEREVLELSRDHAADLYERMIGRPWRPRRGSMVNHRTMTAAVIDSRDHISAKRRADRDIYIPEGTRIVFSGGPDYQDHRRIWAVLDKALEKHPKMVLIHSGGTRGAPHIADLWAKARNVPSVAFHPNWARFGRNRAGFIANDDMLKTVPHGVIVFPGAGVTLNLRDKAKKLGLKVMDLTREREPAPPAAPAPAEPPQAAA